MNRFSHVMYCDSQNGRWAGSVIFVLEIKPSLIKEFFLLLTIYVAVNQRSGHELVGYKFG
jgi:hypothetical protein